MAANYRRELTIVLTGDAKGLTGTVRVTRGDLDALGRTLDKTSGTAERSGKRIGRALDKSEASASRLNSTASRLGKTLVGALSVAALLQTARGLGRMADEYSNIGAQMRQASENAVSFGQAQATAYGVAQRTTASLASTAQLISNVNRALRSMGQDGVAAFQHSAQLAESINQAIALSHVSAAASDAALVQLNQGLASGTLRGDELNSVMEQTPRLAKAIADGMGVTIGQLRAMGAEGKITSQIVVEALKSQAEVLKKEYADLPLTIGRSWTQLTNAVERYVGQADQAKGASRTVAEAISAVATHVNEIARAVVTLGEVVAVVYAKKLIVWGLAWIASLRVQTAAVETETVAMTGLGVRAAETAAITKSALVAQSGWAATTKANFAAAFKSIGKMGVALNVIGAAIVGWQIGSYLYDQFAIVRKAADYAIWGILGLWEKLKEGAILAWLAIKERWVTVVGDMKVVFYEFLQGVATSLQNSMIPGLAKLGDSLAGSIAGKLHDAQMKVIADQTKIAIEVLKVKTATDAKMKQMGDTFADMIAHEDDATKAAKTHTAAVADQNKKLAQNAAATATAKAAQDALNTARQSAHDKLQSMAASNQDAQDKLNGLTQAQIHYRHAIANVVEIYDDLLAKGDSLADANAFLNKGVLQAQKAFQLESQAAKEAAKSTNTFADTQDKAAQRVLELQRSVAQEFAGFWANSASSVSKAFGDLTTDGFKTFDDFADSVGSVFKQMASDIIAQFARLEVVGPMLNGVMNTVGGWMGYAGQFLQGSSFSQAANYYGGGSTISPTPAMGGGGAAGGGYGNYLKQGLSAYKAYQWASTGGLWGSAAAAGSSALGAGAGIYGGLYGGSAALGAASAAGSFTGAGALAGGTYVGGTGLFASTAGTGAAGTAAAGVSWIPIIGWIVAAVLENISLYKQGYDAGAPINANLSSPRRLALDSMLDPAQFSIFTADKALRSLGANDFIASLFSGSSIATAIWGHKKPHLTRGGVDATFGAGGVSGNTYADWKASGGWFTNADYGTETQALNSDTITALNKMWGGITDTMTSAANNLGVSVDKTMQGFSIGLKTVVEKGEDEASKYIVTYLGKTWEEATAQAAQERIGAEGLIRVLKQSVGAAADQFADHWRSDADTLMDGATAMLAIQSDIMHGQTLVALGSKASFAQVVTFVEGMQAEGEKLTQTYQRLQAASQAYLQFVGQFAPATANFGGVLEGIAKQMQANIDQANALAKAAGMQGAAEKDLTNIHRVAAEQAADAIAKLNVAAQSLASKLYDVTSNSLQAVSAQLDKLQGKTQSALQLAIGDKSPLSVTEKLALALKGLRSGLTSADDVLSLGKQLYRGADYAGLYNKVQSIMGLPGAGGVGNLSDAITKYTDLYGKQQTLQDQATAMGRFGDAKTLAQYLADISTTHGISYSEAAKNLGFGLGDLAKDLGVTNVTGYLNKLKLQDVGTGMTDSSSIVSAIHDLGHDLIQSITGAPLAPDTAVLGKISIGNEQQTKLLQSIDQRLAAIEGSNEATAKHTGDQAKTTRGLALRQTAAGTRTLPA